MHPIRTWTGVVASLVAVAAWGEDGVETRYKEIDGANHFTVIAPLADPASAMCERLKQLAAGA